ncbi:MAG TPA: ABC-F family ATP-binding cassette domain-containing protein [Actinomycetota bacterium]|nr:ABC-F family ATP-binding cassette domain-containing protein [Actinomycetota bacterium]
MLTIDRLDKAFGARDLFAAASMQVYARDRVAIVGPNGSGKTTLFDMIAGDQAADGGEIRMVRDAVVGYLRQETDALLGRTVLDEVVSVGSTLADTGHRLAVLEAEMAELGPGPERDRAVSEYGALQHRFAAMGGYSVEHEAKRILSGLGFETTDFERLTDTFSGGWQMRIALAKLLLANPDLLMLDEPTNHLDLASVVWLERFLRTYEGAVLLISHDRDLINGLATKIVELRDEKLYSYSGNYEAFVAARELELEQAEATMRNQARKIAQTERFINRFRYKASLASRVQSRIKALDKMERVDAPRRTRKTMNLTFPPPPRSGRVMIELASIRFGYGETPVYTSLDLVVERGEKVALVGPNGAGKSTLLKLLAGVLTPQGGDRKLGHNVALGYFAQHQIEALTGANTVLHELRSAVPPGIDVNERRLLGRFLFSGDDVEKKIDVLSGGERTRVALAKLLVSPVNLLCLDEPTNHLDMWSRDVLEDALGEYDGSIVLITHDRHLIRSVANRIVEVDEGRVSSFNGDYDYYLSKKEDSPLPEPGDGARPDAVRPSGVKTKDQRRADAEARARTRSLRERVGTIERQLEELGAEISKMEETFASPDIYMSGADVGSLTTAYERAKKRRSRLEVEWADAQETLEAASGRD